VKLEQQQSTLHLCSCLQYKQSAPREWEPVCVSDKVLLPRKQKRTLCRKVLQTRCSVFCHLNITKAVILHSVSQNTCSTQKFTLQICVKRKKNFFNVGKKIISKFLTREDYVKGGLQICLCTLKHSKGSLTLAEMYPKKINLYT
jgi:hypothetical protein